MNNQILFAILAVLAATVYGAVLKPRADSISVVGSPVELEIEPSTVQLHNLNVGWVNAGDRLLYRNYFIKSPMASAIQSQDIIYRGNATTRIAAIQVNEYGATQFASARIISGGLNSNNVTIRLSTARGRGYYFLLDIYGR